MRIIEIRDPWSDGPYVTVVTDSKHEIARIKQRGEQLGYIIRDRRADSPQDAWRFFDRVSGR